MKSSFFYRVVMTAFVLSSLNLSISYCRESIYDVSKLSCGQVQKVYYPHSIEEVQHIVKNTCYPISIAGGRFSQGGHIWNDNGITIDLKYINKIKKINTNGKTLVVEAGATWRQIQEYIDKYNLSLCVMQSYNDFSVGGSLSVNAHSRMLEYGSIIETVESIKIILADGSLITANRKENYNIFKAAIGGYGAVGVIVEATLKLVENDIIEEQEAVMSLDYYSDYFRTMIKNNPDVVFHNANLYLDNYNKVSSITWYKSTESCTINDRLQRPSKFSLDYCGFQVARYLKSIQKLRLPLGVVQNKKKIVYRNYEMSSTVNSIEPFARNITTTVLQEYFIPCNALSTFVKKLQEVIKKYNANVMNISIRYIHKDKESIMAYAQAPEAFALVLYVNMTNSAKGLLHAKKWTHELINAVIECKGTYYLPYQLHACTIQFKRIYPRYKELLELKNKVDPHHKFTNTFLQKYII